MKIPEWLKVIADFVFSLFGYNKKPTVIECQDSVDESHLQEESVSTTHEEINSGTSEVKPTDDGGISFDDFNKDKLKIKSIVESDKKCCNCNCHPKGK